MKRSPAGGAIQRSYYVNRGNTATRYVSPRTGLSVVVDDQTGEVLHVGAPGYRILRWWFTFGCWTKAPMSGGQSRATALPDGTFRLLEP